MTEETQRISKSVYFNTPDDYRLYVWATEEDMPNKGLSSFPAYIRYLLAQEWERQNMSSENQPSQGRILQRLDTLESLLLLVLDQGYVAVKPAALAPVADTSNGAQQHISDHVSSLVDTSDWSD